MGKEVIGKGLVFMIIGLFLGASNTITPNMFVKNVKADSETIFSDDFNDNIKDTSKWTEIFTDGTWWEQNQRTEFQLYESGGGERFEGIKSSGFTVSLSSSQSVIITTDMLTDIEHLGQQWVGYIYLEVTDGTNWILAGYRRGTDDTFYQDSNDPSYIILNDNKYDGIWDNEIQIFSNKYSVRMDADESGWVYDTIFSSNPTLRVRIYIQLGGSFPDRYWVAGFDNVMVVEGGGNNPPNTPSNPNPVNHATGVDINADLSWTGGDPDSGDTVTYDVYFGTSSNPPIVSTGQSGTSYDPGAMSYNTKYYWKIVAKDNHGATATGSIWDFTTGDQPNNPPNTPSNPNPVNHATGVDINADLSWDGGDPDTSDTVYYEIYFGTTTPPSHETTTGTYPATQTRITYEPGLKITNQKYYWKIVAKDNHGGITTGPIWDFTTTGGENQPPTAYIDTISPNPAGQYASILFSGHGTDPDGTITGYYWQSSIDGLLSDTSSFYSLYLSVGTHTITYKVKDDDGVWSSPVSKTLTIIVNTPPYKPSTPSGPTTGSADYSYTYSTITSDFEGDNVRYGWDWNSDLIVDEWTGYSSSGTTINIDHSWSKTGKYYVSVKAEDKLGTRSSFSESLSVNIKEVVNHPPNTPKIPSGSTTGNTGVLYGYSTSATDSDGDNVRYGWDWNGDKRIDGWTSYNPSGNTITSKNSWWAGTYYIQVLAEDKKGAQSGWSSSLKVTISGNKKPVAFIDKIDPTYAATQETISFEGHGTDSDGQIIVYRWKSSIDGIISDKATFQKSGLSPGRHTISFWVKDNSGQWSDATISYPGILIVKGMIFRPKELTKFPYLYTFEKSDHHEYPPYTTKARASTQYYSGAMCSGSSAFLGCCDSWAQIGSEFTITTTKKVTLSTLYMSKGGKLNVLPIGFSSSAIDLTLYKKVGSSWSPIYGQSKEVDPFFDWNDFLEFILWLASLGTIGLGAVHSFMELIENGYRIYNIEAFTAALIAKNCDYNSITSNSLTLTPGTYKIANKLSSSASGGIFGCGNAARVGCLPYLAINEVSSTNAIYTKSDSTINLRIITDSKIDVNVTDSKGQFINKTSSKIPYATYRESDVDYDNESEDLIIIPNPINGEYKINVIPNSDAYPDDTFSIMYTTDGSNFEYIAENVKISDIPTEPYSIEITSKNQPFVDLLYPTGYIVSDNLTIVRWNAYDNENGYNLSISIYYSDDDGINWYLINNEPVDSIGVFCWDTTLVPDGTYLIRVEAADNDGNIGYDSSEQFLISNRRGASPDNQPPSKPSVPSGDTSGTIGVEYPYSCNTSDVENDPIYYLFDWGDGNNSGWLGPYNSGETSEANYIWNVKGNYNIKVKAKDIYGVESSWSDPLPITMPYSYNPLLQFLDLLFQRFPHAFPILRHLLGY